MRHRLSYTLATLVLALLHQTSMALPEDSKLPINIQSDRASQKTNTDGEITEYFGNVLMTQGSLKISGDHIVVRSKNRKVISIVALGKPAHFEQQSDPAKAPIKADANKLDYRLKQDTVILSDNASIEQNGTTVTGQKIEYNIASEQVKAQGGKDESSRVQMVLIPETSSDTEASPTTENNNSKQP
ncbi:lipopolysaccharide transport periplasmic protein LptA [Oceanicoccus sagamiensis]|uniref:Lipopolysaccharide export system protein LptA n=2 Tax=Oceanicoccus sagamiensis TaxID=716816 RepID=A0A1X9NCI2_9GAMM|nr:lipopolysaccharide transport periplasmic protein LptA [Oceanicoccus sagamiensis]